MAESSLGGPLLIEQGYSDPDLGVSLATGGIGLKDTRFGTPYGAAGATAYGFLGTTSIPVIDQVPSTVSTTAIAAGQNTTTGPLTLVASSSGTTGITVLTTALTIQPSGNVIPVGAIAIDLPSGVVNWGQTKKINIYDPTTALARAISIASNSTDTSATFTVNGWDIYGYPMTEAITGGAAATKTGKKAFKFIKSIVATGTVNSTSVSAGQSDVYGFPLRVDHFANIEIYWGTSSNYIAASNTGTFAFADVTNPATTTTGDVRGTYSTSTASNSTLRMQMFVTPSVADILSYTGSYPSGLFGMQQK
jgi:hypothetical protein